MSGDDIKHQMDFILKQQAIFSSDMIELKNRLDQLTVGHQEQREIVQRQGENIARLGETVDRVAAVVQHLAQESEANRKEMREAIENLIIGNEATRELANKAAQLAIGVSQRLTEHERDPHK
ncbi:MAG: hypothetical protein ACREDR_00725 [Blastocatellia bacterium]